MSNVHTSAVVIVPPESTWSQIQEIRSIHDKAYDRWMPHINLLYPFIPEKNFLGSVPTTTKALKSMEPFKVRFEVFEYFSHHGSATLHLKPETEPPLALKVLQSKLENLFPHCNNLSTMNLGFTPHLTVGQFSKDTVEEEKLKFSEFFTPIEFTVSEIHFICRRGGEPFKTKYRIPLGLENTEVKKDFTVPEPKKIEAGEPTHFLAFRINNEQVIENIKKTQQQLLEDHPYLKFGMIPASKFHLTLFVMSLTTPTMVEKAQDALKDCASILSHFPKPKVNLASLGNFGNCRVLWVGCKNDANLVSLTNLEEEILKKFRGLLPSSVNIPEPKGDWQSHLTIYKTGPHLKEEEEIFLLETEEVRVTPDICDLFLDQDYGVQDIDGIELLELKGSQDGYYVCHAKLYMDGRFETIIERKQKELMAIRQDRRKKLLEIKKKGKNDPKSPEDGEAAITAPSEEIDLSFWDTLRSPYPPIEVNLTLRIPKITKKVQKWIKSPKIRQCLPKTRKGWSEIIKPFCKHHVEVLPPDFVVYRLQKFGLLSLDERKVTYLKGSFDVDRILEKDVYDKLEGVQVVQHKVLIRCFEWICRVMSFGPQTYYGLLNSLTQMCLYSFEVNTHLVIDELIKSSTIKGIV